MISAKVKCLCSSCSKHCNAFTKSEFAFRGALTYIYLNNGRKVTNTCNQYKAGVQIANPVPATATQTAKTPEPAFSLKLNFNYM